MRFFDSHTHMDTRGLGDIQTLAMFGVEALVTCAHDAMPFSSADTLLDHYGRLLDYDCRRLRANAITPYVALGVHPRGAPKRGLTEVLDRLPELLRQAPVVAVGEIGLETGSADEVDLFHRQLEIAKAMGLPCIVHTPAQEKATITERALSLVQKMGIDQSTVVVDHVDELNIDLVRDTDCWIGLTVQAGKLTEGRAADLIKAGPLERMLLNSDLASASLELLALPKAALELRKRGFPREDLEKITFTNACKFFRVTP